MAVNSGGTYFVICDGSLGSWSVVQAGCDNILLWKIVGLPSLTAAREMMQELNETGKLSKARDCYGCKQSNTLACHEGQCPSA